MTKNLLLISNSTLHGSGYQDHCADEICKFLDDKITILFIPYARPSGMTHEEYTKVAQERFKKMGYKLTGIHEYNSQCSRGDGGQWEIDVKNLLLRQQRQGLHRAL